MSDKHDGDPARSEDRRGNDLNGAICYSAAPRSWRPRRSRHRLTEPHAQAQPQQQPAPATGRRPNILVIFGDDIGQANSAPTRSA